MDKVKILSKEAILEARKVVTESSLGIKETPTILVASKKQISATNKKFIFSDALDKLLPEGAEVYVKLENTQKTGSFKLRGIAKQVEALEANKRASKKDVHLVTMSGGNYGKAFAYAVATMGWTGSVMLSENAPRNRVDAIRQFGVQAKQLPSAELMDAVRQYQDEHGATFLHPNDDLNLIAGHGSLGCEVLDQVPDVDIVLVCCGGGGLLAGVSTAIASLADKDVIIYGVEPEKANGMFQSLKVGHGIDTPNLVSIATGLSPPFTGQIAFDHVRKFCKGILLVSEDELKATVMFSYEHGLVVEASGAAALAALLHGKLNEAEGKDNLKNKKIVVVLTGGNIHPEEFHQLDLSRNEE